MTSYQNATRTATDSVATALQAALDYVRERLDEGASGCRPTSGPARLVALEHALIEAKAAYLLPGNVGAITAQRNAAWMDVERLRSDLAAERSRCVNAEAGLQEQAKQLTLAVGQIAARVLSLIGSVEDLRKELQKPAPSKP